MSLFTDGPSDEPESLTQPGELEAMGDYEKGLTGAQKARQRVATPMHERNASAGHTSVIWDASTRNDLAAVVAALQAPGKQDLNYPFSSWANMTVVHKAAQDGRPQILDALLAWQPRVEGDRRASVRAVDDEGQTPLHVAASANHGSEEIVAALLRFGASPGAADDDGATPLHNAASKGSAAVVALLLDAGAAPAAATPDGYTVLHAAASGGSVRAAKLLLAAGVSVDARDDNEQTALLMAAHSGHAGLFAVLVAAGAAVGAVDCDGMGWRELADDAFVPQAAIAAMIEAAAAAAASPGTAAAASAAAPPPPPSSQEIAAAATVLDTASRL